MLQAASAVLLIALVLYGAWRLYRRRVAAPIADLPEVQVDPVESAIVGELVPPMSRQMRRALERQAEWRFHESRGGAPLVDTRTGTVVSREQRKRNADRRLAARKELARPQEAAEHDG